jgi:TRAP-type C4-dicarboxylate transport system substrate-binding protein
MLDALELPGLFYTSVEATEVLWGMHDESSRFRDEFADYRMIAMYTADIGEVWTTRPVRSPADMQGLNLRSPSPMAERTLRQFGSGVVGMGMPDVYDSIERGVIDGLATAPSAINTYNLYEVLGYGTIGMNLYAGAQLMAISTNAWNRLPSDLQDLISEATGRNFSIGVADQYDRLGAEARDGIAGVEFQILTEAEQAVFAEAAYPVIAEYLSILDSMGYDGQEFFDLMISVRDRLR